MKTKQIYAAAAIIAIALISSCTKTKDNVPDPTGTITTNLNSWIMLYEGTASVSYVTQYGTYPNIQRILGMDIPSLTTSFQIKLADAYNGYINWDVESSGGSEVVNIGEVNGLGNVTTKPASGYTKSCSLQKGHGYVVRYKKSYNTPSDATFYYARFYLVSWVVSTTGGIMGANITFQSPF
jgi:hypothetical protein